MSQNAAGQLLGYAIQFPRALCHLLKATPGCKICIEVHGDVATVHPSGEIISEEDKSSISTNPLTDKSIDLWKSLSNWVNSVIAGEFNPILTTFVLYRNRSGRSGLAETFNRCTTKEQAEQALLDVTRKFTDVDDSHAIWPYYKNVMQDHRNTLIDVIIKLKLETGDPAGYLEVKQALMTKLIPSNQIDVVIQYLNGWLVKLVMSLISQKQPATISFEEFLSECTVLFARARCLELLDFTTHAPPSSAAIAQQMNIRPTYLRQIEFVNANDDDLIGAVTDFLKAKINRDKWIEKELIDEDVASQFEDGLKRFWGNKKKEVNLVNRELGKEERGMLLLALCQNHHQTIRNESPPPSTIAGTYHALADKLTLGWHDDWATEFKI